MVLLVVFVQTLDLPVVIISKNENRLALITLLLKCNYLYQNQQFH